jgi:hypothetical protein
LSSEKRLSTGNDAGEKIGVNGGLTAVRMKAGNPSVAIDDARSGALIDIFADPAEGQRNRPAMENHDTVICASPDRGKQDDKEETEIPHLTQFCLLDLAPWGSGATGAGGWGFARPDKIRTASR